MRIRLIPDLPFLLRDTDQIFDALIEFPGISIRSELFLEIRDDDFPVQLKSHSVDIVIVVFEFFQKLIVAVF